MTSVRDAIDRLSVALGGDVAACLAATALIESEALGQTRFGLALLDEWTSGTKALPPSEGRVVTWHDCSSTFSPLAVATATLNVATTARVHGIGAAFLRGVRGFGRLSPFVRHLADQGLVGFAAAEGPPFVVPLGGSRPVIGTNPIAFAMGRDAGRVVIDAATSTETMAGIRTARTTGRTLPERVAVDSEGRPTRIAAEVAALLPRGGQIGSLLGLVVELLAGVASGARGDLSGRGVFLLAINPETVDGETDWRRRLEALQGDWTDGGGHWPSSGAQTLPATLDASAVERLDAHLFRMTAEGNR